MVEEAVPVSRQDAVHRTVLVRHAAPLTFDPVHLLLHVLDHAVLVRHRPLRSTQPRLRLTQPRPSLCSGGAGGGGSGLGSSQRIPAQGKGRRRGTLATGYVNGYVCMGAIPATEAAERAAVAAASAAASWALGRL